MVMLIGYTEDNYPVYEDDDGYWVDDPADPGYVTRRPVVTR